MHLMFPRRLFTTDGHSNSNVPEWITEATLILIEGHDDASMDVRLIANDVLRQLVKVS
jgi:hypothetical protein